MTQPEVGHALPHTRDAAKIPDIPQPHVLGYLTGPVETPTRVRLVAARLTLAAGLVAMMLSVLLLVALASEVYDLASRPLFFWGFAPPMPPFTWTRWTRATADVLKDEPFAFGLLACLATGAVLLLLLARQVKRGRRAASKIVLTYFALSIIPMFLATLLLSCGAFVSTFNASPSAHNWWAVLWLLGLPLGGMICILLKDVCAFLLWIIRNPSMEKPPVPFMPGTASRPEREAAR